MLNRFTDENTLYQKGFEYVVGVDEVGRGPLAGPVVASAVVFTKELNEDWWHEIADSKKLSESKRERLSDSIMNNSFYSFGIASVTEIEDVNILQASFLAMSRALDGLKINLTNSAVLVDGKFLIPELLCKEQRAVVKGDSLVHSIAAASILAKVNRDNFMKDLSEQYPEYGFAQHKGYGTKAHIESIKKHGLSPVHRASFCGKIV